MTWTHFHDMHSGGGSKEQWGHIFIEAPETEAKVIFYNRFGHNPERVTCTCCGDDYSISEHEDIQQATGFERGCDYAYFDEADNEIPSDGWRKPLGAVKEGYVERKAIRMSLHDYTTLSDYAREGTALFIRADEIKPEWRTGEVPSQGYVWVD